MINEREIIENNLIYIFNDLNYGQQFLNDFLSNHEKIDANILLGMMPYLVMIYYSSRDFFLKHEITFGENKTNLTEYYDDKILNDIRSVNIKLYTENDSWKNNLNHYNELLKDTIRYEIYLSDGHIISNTHLKFFKQFDKSLNTNKFTHDLLKKFIILNQINQKWLCKLENFKFDLKTEPIPINLNICCNTHNFNCVIGFIDVLATLNFYKLYLSNNVIDEIMDVKIKYQIFVNSLYSVINLNKNISTRKFLNDEELLELEKLEKKYVKNSLYNKTKHGNFIDKYTPIEILTDFKKDKVSMFVNIIEFLSGYSYSDFNSNINNAINTLIDILEEHIFVVDKKLLFYFSQ